MKLPDGFRFLDDRTQTTQLIGYLVKQRRDQSVESENWSVDAVLTLLWHENLIGHPERLSLTSEGYTRVTLAILEKGDCAPMDRPALRRFVDARFCSHPGGWWMGSGDRPACGYCGEPIADDQEIVEWCDPAKNNGLFARKTTYAESMKRREAGE